MALIPGARFGLFDIVAPLGEGGMGEVYRARDTQLKRDVAIKILPGWVLGDPDPSTGSGSSQAGSRDDRLARFQREAEILASLNHTNIAHIHGLAESGAQGIYLGSIDDPSTVRQVLPELSSAVYVAPGHVAFACQPSGIIDDVCIRDMRTGIVTTAIESRATFDHSRILVRVPKDADKDHGEMRLLFGWAQALREAAPRTDR